MQAIHLLVDSPPGMAGPDLHDTVRQQGEQEQKKCASMRRGICSPARPAEPDWTALFGVDALNMRLACLGYLLPIRAHSYHEIMAAARRHGLPYKDGDYYHIPPLSDDEVKRLWDRVAPRAE